MIIHVLLSGRACCGIRGLPKDWPKDHFWVRMEDVAKANCVDCLEQIKKAAKK